MVYRLSEQKRCFARTAKEEQAKLSVAQGGFTSGRAAYTTQYRADTSNIRQVTCDAMQMLPTAIPASPKPRKKWLRSEPIFYLTCNIILSGRILQLTGPVWLLADIFSFLLRTTN